MDSMPRELEALLAPVVQGRVVVLTGAGVSAESGIPTFRGPQGFWSLGSKVYTPQEMATRSFFRRDPRALWSWYLYRRQLCRQAEPNAAHRALSRLEQVLQERFLLVTQNVDGLHARAGSSQARTLEIHGNLHRMRCSAECHAETYALPDGLGAWERGRNLEAAEERLLRCPRCGGPARPHVLWFDETYGETLYRSDSALQALLDSDWLLVIGTSGATFLPSLMGEVAARQAMPLVNIDPEGNPFAARAGERGMHWRGPAARLVPVLVAWVESRQTR